MKKQPIDPRDVYTGLFERGHNVRNCYDGARVYTRDGAHIATFPNSVAIIASNGRMVVWPKSRLTYDIAAGFYGSMREAIAEINRKNREYWAARKDKE
jgi:hypothetical protein